MNRSAEAAAPAAKNIFFDAILAMSFTDARKILSGGDTAATDYFRQATSEKLSAAFRPFIEKTMDENSVTQQYRLLAGQAQRIPFLKTSNFDITQYVVSKAIDGLFYMLGQEEKKIRKDPAAQTTACSERFSASEQINPVSTGADASPPRWREDSKRPVS